MVGKLRDIGMPIEAALETLPATTDEDALGRPRIARALIAAGHATSVEDAFNRHLSRGRLAYVPREGLGPREAIGAIRAAGGLASLAHYPEAPDNLDFLRELIEMGLNGLEVHYRAYDPDTVRTMRGDRHGPSASSGRAARTTTATGRPTPRRTPSSGTHPRSMEGLRSALGLRASSGAG